jgi:hypothetical protein
MQESARRFPFARMVFLAVRFQPALPTAASAALIVAWHFVVRLAGLSPEASIPKA